MNRNNHIIQKQIIELEMPPGSRVSYFQDSIRNIYYERILPELDKLFSEFSNVDTIIRLDKLDLDIGKIGINNFEDQLVENILIAAKKQLEEKLQFNVNDKSEIDLIHYQKSVEDIFIYFLEFGHFPWWSRINDLVILETKIMNGDLINPDLADKLKSLISTNPFVLQRLVFQFSNDFMHFLVHLYFPFFKSKKVLNEIKAFFSDRLKFDLQFLCDTFWEIIFKNLSTASDTLDLKLIREFLAMLAAYRKMTYNQFAHLISKTNSDEFPYLNNLFKIINITSELYTFDKSISRNEPDITNELKGIEDGTLVDLVKQQEDESGKKEKEEHTKINLIDADKKDTQRKNFTKNENNLKESEKGLQAEKEQINLRDKFVDPQTFLPAKEKKAISSKPEDPEKTFNKNLNSDDTDKINTSIKNSEENLPGKKNKDESKPYHDEMEKKFDEMEKFEKEISDVDKIDEIENLIDSVIEAKEPTDTKQNKLEMDFENIEEPNSGVKISTNKEEKSNDTNIDLITNSIINKACYSNEYFKEDSEIYSELAGLVILHPFLVNFLEGLKLISGKSFIDQAALHKSVYLLGNLCTGEFDLQEQRLVIPKLLCGMELNAVIKKPVVINEEEQIESEKLLTTVISYWSALKSTTPEGLRNTFLKREGKLSRNNNAWQLDVEKKPWDILLGKLPWGFSIIQLPWMDDLLFVNWGN